MFTLNCKGRLLVADKPLVMGIINSTPDSFYGASRQQAGGTLLQKAEQMLAEGAAILDIGGQSTRPGSQAVSQEEELHRVIGPIAALHQQLPEAVISVDTFYAKVAAEAVAAGASIVNDISAGEMDKAMLPTVAALKVPYICMHMKGTPQTMQQHTQYEHLLPEIIDYFIAKLDKYKKAGILDVIIDPGFGFSKTIAQNFALLKQLQLLQILEKPVLAGLSRKGTIYKTLGSTPEKALNGTTVLNTLALQNGASILRVHDVKEAVEAVTLYSEYLKA